MTDVLITGDGEPTLVLAHSAGAPMDSPFMNTVADGLAERGFRVVRFEFPYMVQRREQGGRRPPNPANVLLETWREVAWRVADEMLDGALGELMIGGKSMGGRYATRVADELGVAVCAVFGYPFHPPRKPEKLRTAHLEDLTTPTLILQGTRDRMGTPDDVAGYDLSDAIEIVWLEDGDHSLKPRKRSGHTLEAHLETAMDEVVRFAGERGHLDVA